MGSGILSRKTLPGLQPAYGRWSFYHPGAAPYRFPGAVIEVSHNRLFIDKIANCLRVFDGERREINGNWATRY